MTSDLTAVEQMVAKTVDAFGSLDLFVSNVFTVTVNCLWTPTDWAAERLRSVWGARMEFVRPHNR